MWFRYQNGTDTPVSQFLRPLRSPSNQDVQGEEVITLRRRRVRKVTGIWTFWEVAIGMDELYDPAKLAFLVAWWSADRCYIEESDDPETEPDDTWIEVTPPTGPLPITYPTGSRHLPSFSATIYATVGS